MKTDSTVMQTLMQTMISRCRVRHAIVEWQVNYNIWSEARMQMLMKSSEWQEPESEHAPEQETQVVRNAEGSFVRSNTLTLMVHCSSHGNVHSYGSGEEEKWIYFDEVREHYEAMHKVAEELLQEEVKQLESQRHCVPWECYKCTYVNAGT